MKFRIGKCALIGQMPLILVPAEFWSARSNLFAPKTVLHCKFQLPTAEAWAYLESTDAPRSLSRALLSAIDSSIRKYTECPSLFSKHCPLFSNLKNCFYASKIENSICKAGTRMSENDIHGSVFPCKITAIQLLMKSHLCILISFYHATCVLLFSAL